MHFSLIFCEIENRDSIDLSLWTEYIFNRLQKYSQSNNFFSFIFLPGYRVASIWDILELCFALILQSWKSPLAPSSLLHKFVVFKKKNFLMEDWLGLRDLIQISFLLSIHVVSR